MKKLNSDNLSENDPQTKRIKLLESIGVKFCIGCGLGIVSLIGLIVGIAHTRTYWNYIMQRVFHSVAGAFWLIATFTSPIRNNKNSSTNPERDDSTMLRMLQSIDEYEREVDELEEKNRGVGKKIKRKNVGVWGKDKRTAKRKKKNGEIERSEQDMENRNLTFSQTYPTIAVDTYSVANEEDPCPL